MTRDAASRGVRVAAGSLRGRLLAVPASARPSSARLRQALLDALAPWLPDARVLDVFAGSGAFGIEAVSRGARIATFIEADRAALRTLERNLELLAGGDRCERLAGDALTVLARLATAKRRFEVVFADPPYARLDPDSLLPLLVAVVEPGGVLVVEHERRRELPAAAGDLLRSRTRTYGDGAVSWYEAAVPSAP